MFFLLQICLVLVLVASLCLSAPYLHGVIYSNFLLTATITLSLLILSVLIIAAFITY